VTTRLTWKAEPLPGCGVNRDGGGWHRRFVRRHHLVTTLLVNQLAVHKHAICLRSEAGKKQRTLLLKHNLVRLCLANGKFVTPLPLKSKMSARRKRTLHCNSVAIHKSLHCTREPIAGELDLRLFFAANFKCKSHNRYSRSNAPNVEGRATADARREPRRRNCIGHPALVGATCQATISQLPGIFVHLFYLFENTLLNFGRIFNANPFCAHARTEGISGLGLPGHISYVD